MKHNTGEAILILGSIYFFTIIDHWARWLLFILVGFAGWTWSKNVFFPEQHELLKVSLTKLKLEIELMKAQTQFYIARGAALLKGLKLR